MQHKQVVITHAYHFLCEMIILFLLSFPLFYHYYKWVPHESYLVILAVSCLIFSLIAYKKWHMIWLLLGLPVLGVVFIILDYPTVFAILFSVVFVIDYVIIHKQELPNREAIYIITGIIVTGVLLLITNTWTFLGYLLLLIFITGAGYALSQIAATDNQARKQFPYRLFLYFGIILITFGSMFLFLGNLLKNGVSFILELMVAIFTGGLSGLASIVSYFFSGERDGWPEQNSEGETPDRARVTEQDLVSYTDYLTLGLFIVVGSVLILFIILIAIMVLKKRKSNEVAADFDDTSPELVYNLQYDDIDKAQKGFRNPFRILKKPEHPIRKLVFQFERKAEKNKKGRLPFETIGEWLSRIGMDDELNIYQQVRYGDASNISEEDTEWLKRRLKELQDELENK